MKDKQSLKAVDYSSRRAAVAERIGADGVLVLFASAERVRSHDTLHPYRPSNDLLYLCGFPEPEAVLVLTPGRAAGELTLFVRPRDAEREMWDGYREGPEGAVARFGASEAWPIEELDRRLVDLLRGRRTLHYGLGEDVARDQAMVARLARLRANRRAPDQGPLSIVDPRPLLTELRWRKDEAELERMRIAARISAEAHVLGMQQTRPGMYEYEVQALMEAHMRASGGSGPSYGSIVAGGARGCVLHYTSNDQVLADGETVLVDSGAEYDWYAGDITRVWPVGRRFSPAQRAVYEAVLDAQEHTVSLVRAGTDSQALHAACLRRLTERAIDLGLLRGGVDELVESQAVRAYFPHGTGHYLGMDVHDPGPYFVAGSEGPTARPLEPGVVLTVEPGLYIRPDDESAPEALRGIAVRIEDDVVVLDGGGEVLTGGVPKSVAGIEALRA